MRKSRNKLYKRRSLRKTFKGGMKPNPLHARESEKRRNKEILADQRQLEMNMEIERQVAETEMMAKIQKEQEEMDKMKTSIAMGIIEDNAKIMKKIFYIAFHLGNDVEDPVANEFIEQVKALNPDNRNLTTDNIYEISNLLKSIGNNNKDKLTHLIGYFAYLILIMEYRI